MKTNLGREEFERTKGRLFMPPSGTGGEAFSLTVCCPEYGWMPARLRLGGDCLPIMFSDVYPPFLDLVTWLEELIAGLVPGPWHVDSEHETHYFSVAPTEQPGQLALEYLRESWDEGRLYRSALLDRERVVREFYWVLRFLMGVDFEGEAERPDGTSIWFHFDRHFDDIIRFDLSRIEAWLRRGEAGQERQDGPNQ